MEPIFYVLQVLNHVVNTECWCAEGDTTIEIRSRVKGQPRAAAAAGQPGQPGLLEPRRQ